jgi:hypothetical protein
MDEQQDKAWKIDQTEAAYIPLSTTRGQACANCRWFNPNGEWDSDNTASCHLVSGWPEPILATGHSNRWEAKPVPVEPDIEPMPVVIVEPPIADEDSGMMRALGEVEMQPGVFERILSRIKAAVFGEPKESQFKSLGNGLWLAWYTNNAEDREGEILAESAHDSYVRRLQSGVVPMPVLEFWHIPGSEHGKALWVDRIGHSMLAVGVYDDTPLAKAMQTHYEQDKPSYGMSHGFTADKSKHFKDGVWWQYNTHEISVLPVWAAANVLTLFEGQPMASEQSLAALQSILEAKMGSKEAAKSEMERIEAQAKSRDKAVTELGRYKDYVEIPTDESPADAEKADEDNKAFGELVLELMQAQGDSAQIMLGMDNRIKGLESQLAARDTIITTLQSQLELQPRASVAAQTQITNAALEAQIKQQLPGEEYDPFWGDMKVKKAVR